MSPAPAITRILLIDDHALVRAGYKYLLHCTRHLQVVAEASTAVAGYRRFLRGGVDVTVLDLSLPGAGGLEILRRMRCRQRDARVLVVSMHDEPAMVERAIGLGAAGYLCKRSNPEMLVEAVTAVASGSTFVDPSLTRSRPRARGTQGLERLSEREFEIFRQLAEGQPVEAIARSLHLSTKTVANYGTAIRNKLQIENRAEMARVALAAGIVTPI
ncbi:LuxR family two component transcriptional regulator [Panacagrimonas perspica]|uniref:LuxR family two component transcriptional regulator n=1 Tax=Panacagrimonas perspica TaxID=381431 RepID=A0A4R7NZH4_9GAMM|nr:response regulator transcription factor [Panacagrimonas perspica]TDU26765.1 LuxR family two component transcriptional regulator [Panacagrimonas perspica]THD04102.1 two-component system response regulator [Panacagrimonas perspica]